MSHTAADILVDTLMEWGVDTVFGLPGDGINGIIEAFRKRQDKVRFIHVRHEESAAFMACAYAKYTGKLGVCVATSGPGGIHLLNGLYDAKLDSAPVLAITGHVFHDLIDTHTQQDVDLDKVFADVSIYNTRVMGASHVRNVTELACRKALYHRGALEFSGRLAGSIIERAFETERAKPCVGSGRARRAIAHGRGSKAGGGNIERWKTHRDPCRRRSAACNG